MSLMTSFVVNMLALSLHLMFIPVLVSLIKFHCIPINDFHACCHIPLGRAILMHHQIMNTFPVSHLPFIDLSANNSVIHLHSTMSVLTVPGLATYLHLNYTYIEGVADNPLASFPCKNACSTNAHPCTPMALVHRCYEWLTLRVNEILELTAWD